MLPPSQHDPFRPVNWRWERARWLREHGRYIRRNVDDQETMVAKKYQADLARAASDLDHARLATICPGVYHAHQIHLREDRDVRWTIEARLLAGEPFTRIAARTMTTPEVVCWYEKLFFNVRPCLGAPDYIANVVIGASMHHGLNDREYDLLWKLFGYFAGTHVLDFLITTFASPTRPEDAASAPAYLADDQRITIKRKSAIAARVLPLHNNFTIQIILETHAKLLEIERGGDGTGGTDDMMMEHIRAMLTVLGGQDGAGDGLLYAGRRGRYMDLPQLEHYDGQAVELRASEQLTLTAGRDTRDFPDPEMWKFPDKPPPTVVEQVQAK